jgi:DDE superfamily endonuclease
VTVFGALEVTAGARVYRLGRRRAADFIAFLDQLLRAFPRAPAIVVICDSDSIHHARAVTACLKDHPAGAAARRAVQPARQPGGADLRRAEELRGQHRRDLARPPQADPRVLPRPLTGPAAGRRRALDSPWLPPAYE